MLPQRQEKRKSFRRPVRRAAEVIFGAHEQAVRCVIWDISDSGARLAIARPSAKIPPTFTLVLFKDGSEQRNCEVVWTDTRFVGVKFTEARL
jgi:hypothetical protein